MLRYRPYFGSEGGITVTGGEALLQPDFMYELFKECHKQNPPIHTCLDTSGCIINNKVCRLLAETDLRFLDLLEERHIHTWIRHVVAPGFNGDSKDRSDLDKLMEGKSCIEEVEYLPFRKLCKEKYVQRGIDFPFDCYEEWEV